MANDAQGILALRNSLQEDAPPLCRSSAAAAYGDSSSMTEKTGAELSRGDSFHEAPAAMDAVESCTRPVEPNKAIAAQFMDFMPGQDEQQQLGKETLK